jgi:thiamine biosynthesis lipoprotein
VTGATTLSHHEEVMGTVVSYRVERGELPEAELERALADSTAELHRLDAMFSTWQPDSVMSRLRRGELALGGAPAEVVEVLELCEQAKELTEGHFDPWAMPGGVDPTGLVKGWAVERAASVLVRHGVPAGLVNGGGDIACFSTGTEPVLFRVGVRHPWRPAALACVVTLGAGDAIATSGTYERGAHLVDPFPERRRRGGGSGGEDQAAVLSASVVGRSLALADGIATGLAVAGKKTSSITARVVAAGYGCYRIYEDGSEELTPAFPLAAPAPSSR